MPFLRVVERELPDLSACLSVLLLHREHLGGGGKGPPGSPQSAVRQQQPGEGSGQRMHDMVREQGWGKHRKHPAFTPGRDSPWVPWAESRELTHPLPRREQYEGCWGDRAGGSAVVEKR